jgi:hypothetical protein
VAPIPAALNRSSARWHRIETEQRLSHHLAKLPSLMIGSLLDGVVVMAAADAQSIASTGERLRQVGPFALLPARASALNWVV